MNDAELGWICRSALEARFPSFRGCDIRASFYPYIGMTHTIRRNGALIKLRISDHCRRAPRIVLEAIAILLGCKLLRRKPARQWTDIYEQFRRHPVVESGVGERRLRKGRKRIGSAEGRHQSLARIFEAVNAAYFRSQVEIARIGWGCRRSWVRLGHYDPAHNTITVSPVLDSEKVPEKVVAYIVYHEMLHAAFGKSAAPGARHHPPAFRASERAHPDYAFARAFLAAYCRSGRRRRQ